MAPSIAQETQDRLRRLLRGLNREQLCRLYNTLIPGDDIQPGTLRTSQIERMLRSLDEFIRVTRVTEERIAEILGYDRIEYAPQPDDLPRGPRVPMPVIPPATPGGVTVGPIPGRRPDPSTLRPTLELTNALWAALGRLLNPANLQEEFASAILRGDMELARVLFDRLQDEGLTY